MSAEGCETASKVLVWPDGVSISAPGTIVDSNYLLHEIKLPFLIVEKLVFAIFSLIGPIGLVRKIEQVFGLPQTLAGPSLKSDSGLSAVNVELWSTLALHCAPLCIFYINWKRISSSWSWKNKCQKMDSAVWKNGKRCHWFGSNNICKMACECLWVHSQFYWKKSLFLHWGTPRSKYPESLLVSFQ